MNASELLDLWREGMIAVAYVSAPFVLGALAIGVATSLLQAATQMQDNIFSFVPKLVIVGLVLALLGHSMLERLSGFASRSFESAAEVGRPAS